MSHDLQIIFGTLGAVAGLCLPLLVWLVKAMLKISQTVYGVHGTNGLKGDVAEYGEKIATGAGILRDHDHKIEYALREVHLSRERYHDSFVGVISECTHSQLRLAEAIEPLAPAIRHLAHRGDRDL